MNARVCAAIKPMKNYLLMINNLELKLINGQSMAGTFGKIDLVVHVVLSDRFAHRQTFDDLQCFAVIDDDFTIYLPDAEQGAAAVTDKLDMALYHPAPMSQYVGVFVCDE